jgi:hypothetical protein
MAQAAVCAWGSCRMSFLALPNFRTPPLKKKKSHY